MTNPPRLLRGDPAGANEGATYISSARGCGCDGVVKGGMADGGRGCGIRRVGMTGLLDMGTRLMMGGPGKVWDAPAHGPAIDIGIGGCDPGRVISMSLSSVEEYSGRRAGWGPD